MVLIHEKQEADRLKNKLIFQSLTFIADYNRLCPFPYVYKRPLLDYLRK